MPANTEGGSPRQVASDGENEGELDWAPSGSLLVFSQLPELGTDAARNFMIRKFDVKKNQTSILPGRTGFTRPIGRRTESKLWRVRQMIQS